MKKRAIYILMSLLGVCGCQAPLASLPARQQDVQKLALGSVQREIGKGTPSSKVIEVLGSPNIVTKNSDGTETWVYDRVSTEAEYAGGFLSSASAKSTRTLMIVIKFDKTNAVDDVKYRQTSY